MSLVFLGMSSQGIFATQKTHRITFRNLDKMSCKKVLVNMKEADFQGIQEWDFRDISRYLLATSYIHMWIYLMFIVNVVMMRMRMVHIVCWWSQMLVGVLWGLGGCGHSWDGHSTRHSKLVPTIYQPSTVIPSSESDQGWHQTSDYTGRYFSCRKEGKEGYEEAEELDHTWWLSSRTVVSSSPDHVIIILSRTAGLQPLINSSPPARNTTQSPLSRGSQRGWHQWIGKM